MAKSFLIRKLRKARSEQRSATAVESVRTRGPWEQIARVLSVRRDIEGEAFFRGFIFDGARESYRQVRILSEAEGLWADWAALGVDYRNAAASVGAGRLAHGDPGGLELEIGSDER